MDAERKTLDLMIFEDLPASGRAHRDIVVSMVRAGHSQRQVEQALGRLLFRSYIVRCGDENRPIYLRSPAKVVYSNIRPAAGVNSLLTMHQNFITEEKPR